MNKLIKFNYLIILILSLFIFSSCVVVKEGYVSLPNLKGCTKQEIIEKLDELGLNYVIYIESKFYTKNYDQFIRYGSDLKSGSVIKKDDFFRVYITPLNLTYKVSDQVHIDFDYKGKSFVNDGVGVVRLARTIDGDTFHGYDGVTGEYIKIRFLGIDTPESTIENDPWGKAASNYCKERLLNAKEIVLEAEGPRKETYGRYLAFVWLDGELYNLQCIEEAYSNSTLGSSSKYYKYFSDVDLHVSQTGRRFFGEYDPDYNYN